jgi:hypothetical protein
LETKTIDSVIARFGQALLAIQLLLPAFWISSWFCMNSVQPSHKSILNYFVEWTILPCFVTLFLTVGLGFPVAILMLIRGIRIRWAIPLLLLSLFLAAIIAWGYHLSRMGFLRA